MKKNNKVLIVIPARGNSKRLKKKIFCQLKFTNVFVCNKKNSKV